MGVQTDLFLASPSEIEAAFSGWHRPSPLLADFVTRTARNPFTGEQLTIRSRIPEDQTGPDDDATDRPDLERFDLVDQKGLSTVNLAQLACALLDWDHDNAHCEIDGRTFAGPPDAGVLLELPQALTRRLADLTRDDCATFGRLWAALFREDANGIKADFIRQHELSRPDSEWIGRLADLAHLARQARATTKSVFVWITA
ncbi:MAG TPA: hypothetical protein VNW92_19585 [Polyangiaceae bacterium]|jgi:hypothetical protein|nr:hypothetical protein [Polyangiaceae bacterium]